MNYSLDFLQIKDDLNYGLVFSGPQHRFIYKRSWELNGKNLMYQGEVGFGTLFSRGMTGLQWKVKPIDVLYNYYELIRKVSIHAGPWLKMEYNYQLYPELQSGYSFHFTNYTMGFAASAKYENDDVYLRLRWKNSLVGLISRTEEDRDPYFFDLSLGTYFKDQHRNFKGGSFGTYNNTWIELLFISMRHPRLGYAYNFEYFSYSDSPGVRAMTHGFSLFFYPKT